MCSKKLRAPVITLLYLKNDKIKQETLSKLLMDAFNQALEKLKSNNVDDQGNQENMNDISEKKETQLQEPKRFAFDQ